MFVVEEFTGHLQRDLWYSNVCLVCVTHLSQLLVLINFSETILLWPVIHLVVSHFFTATRNTTEWVGEKRTKNKRTIWLWVNSKCQKGSFVTLQSRASVDYRRRVFFAKFRQSYKECQLILSVFLTAPGLYLTSTGLFCYPLSTTPLRLPSPTDLSEILFQLPSSPTSGLVRDLESKPIVQFCAKTDKWIVCSADHPHSVTYEIIVLLFFFFSGVNQGIQAFELTSRCNEKGKFCIHTRWKWLWKNLMPPPNAERFFKKES